MIKKCLGCGVKLQDKDDTSCGYVSSMDKDLCTRCFKIKHYNEYKRVSFNNSDYLKIINGINGSNDLVILVVSLFGMGDLLKLRGLIKRKNVLLQCVGASERIEPQVITGNIQEGVYLLCSDGFRHEISSKEIFEGLNIKNLKDKNKCIEKLKEKIEENIKEDTADAIPENDE